MNLHFVLDNMQASGHPIPGYVHYRKKAASDSGKRLDGREELWLEAVKLACTSMRPLEKEIRFHKIAAVADRYGIRNDIDAAVAYIDQLENRREGIRTASDFRKAADWLERHADTLAPEVRASVANHLLEQAVKVGHVTSLTERFRWNEWSGRDPYTDDVRTLAEKNLHKLATGSVYRTDQFDVLSVEELQELLPDLLKTASLGMNVFQADRIGKTASTLPEHEARILENLLESHGQSPVHSDFGSPVEISDEILATL